MILADTNVLLDIFTDDPVWADWSTARLDAALILGPVAINDVVFAGLSVRFERIDDVDAALASAGIEIDPIPREALFLAGKAFRGYRRAGGPRSGVLPDFFIGAHAAVRGWPLITRGARRYRTWFPGLELITPA
ncbi:type II toxin-antitoxin system VapC family toxin [Phreatobacter sp.]|uniref:type II toxin-antitoxin system VapC family toxin n=1 Tax=Phreatobacter sp. TaxID=1966341 RepID=UPI0025FCA150|nr:type II toxin-antitoxin system VapC family toxin [Phreatobacter sp.]